MLKKFNEIRSYADNEVNKVLKQLSKEKLFINLIMQFSPNLTVKQLKEKLNNIKTIFEFQIEILYPISRSIIDRSTSGLTYDGIENIQKDKPYLFISNHRDIILDPTFLNVILYDNGIETSQVAIGNNLLIYSWIKDLVRLSKSFVVKRNIAFSQIFDQSRLLSSYIRYMTTEKKSSVWISQREGRTKDGDDKTQTSVVKMLSLSSDKPLIENLSEFNLVPVSLSYEYEPCDILKATENYKKMLDNSYTKTPADDMKSMVTGIISPKGRVHFSFSEAIDFDAPQFRSIENKLELTKYISQVIDEKIYAGYKLWPVNYIAYDILNNSKTFVDKYSKEDRNDFSNYIDRKLQKIDIDSNLLETLLLNIYANPVKNKLCLQNTTL